MAAAQQPRALLGALPLPLVLHMLVTEVKEAPGSAQVAQQAAEAARLSPRASATASGICRFTKPDTCRWSAVEG